MVLIFQSVQGFSQAQPVYEEVPISLYVTGIGNTEMPAIIMGDEAYLPIKDLFDFIKIKNGFSANIDSIEGYFINPMATYLVDKSQHLIQYQDKTYKLLSTDIIQTQDNLYLKINFFSTVFGLDCVFNFRNLSITLKSQIELPAIREMQQQLLRNNIRHLSGEKKADTTHQRQFKFYNLGSADWSVTASQASNIQNSIRTNLVVGALLAGGEVNVNLNYFSPKPFDWKQQHFRWRYVNDRKSIIRQITAGRIYTNSISSIFEPVNGIQITNTPATHRKSFTTYRYTGNTEPGWGVELYVNSMLVNFVKSDASGFYAFDIPIVYGNSAIVLRFYGLYGEEIIKEENINIPFSFLPQNQLEYVVSAGFVSDEDNNIYSKGHVNYGINNHLTLGAGLEYLSSVLQTKPLVFFNASARFGSSLILNGEYTRDVRIKANLNYRLPMKMQLEINYTKYKEDQIAVFYNYLEERTVSVSSPVRFKKLSAFSRFSFNQILTKKVKFNKVEWLVSLAGRGISSNIKTYAHFGAKSTDIYNEFSFSFKLPGNVRFTPQVQYKYNVQSFGMVKAQVEKTIFNRAILNVAFERNFQLHTSNITMAFRYDLTFAQAFFSVRNSNKITTATQYAKGSLLFAGHGNIQFGNQSGVGKGGLIVLPFIDLNNNGQRDANEPKAFGLILRVQGGRMERNDQDTTILIKGLDAFAEYYIEFDKNSFDNIAWRINHPTVKVFAEPNYFKLIEVPVSVLAEISGMVYILNEKTQKGISRMTVNIYDSKHVKVAQTLTEGDGYFNYLGLAPGTYTARIDTVQLKKLNLISLPDSLTFIIKNSVEGIIADGFNFVVRSLSVTNPNTPIISQDTLTKKETGKGSPNVKLSIPGKTNTDSLNLKMKNTGIKKEPGKNNNLNKPTATIIRPQLPSPKNNPDNKGTAIQNVKQKTASEQDKMIIQFNAAEKKHQQIIYKLDQLQRERQKLLRENLQLHKEIKALRLKIKQQKR